MDVYLPADFYCLRDDLPEWCDPPATDSGFGKMHVEKAPIADTDAMNACADPLWRVF